MKLRLLLLFLLIGFFAKSQIVYTPMVAAGYQYKYLKVDSGYAVPLRDTTKGRGVDRPGLIVCRPQDSLFYGYNGHHWAVMGADVSNLITTINGKVDSVTASGTQICYWKVGVSYCYEFAGVTLNNAAHNGNDLDTSINTLNSIGIGDLNDNYGGSVAEFGNEIEDDGNFFRIHVPNYIKDLMTVTDGGLLLIGPSTGDTTLQLTDEGKLRLPQMAASNNEDSVVVLTDNGTFKKKYIAGGTTPSLQDVMLVGNTTSEDFMTSAQIDFVHTDNTQTILFADNTSTLQNSLSLPKDSSGTIAISVNGVKADDYGNINISGGSGTVTSVATGFGLLGGTITTTGTLLIDSTKVPTLYKYRTDSTATANSIDTAKVNLRLNIANAKNSDLWNKISDALGTTVKGHTVMADVTKLTSNINTLTLVNGNANYVAIWVDDTCTISSVRWWQSTIGNYIQGAGGSNSIALWSYSGGTYTKIASVTDSTLWKVPTVGIKSKDFAAPVTVNPGLYFIGFVYYAASKVTDPVIPSVLANSGTLFQWNYPNSGKILGYRTGQTGLPASTEAASNLTAYGALPYFEVY